MFDYLIIVLTVLTFYLRTLNYSIIVDDIRQYAMIKKGVGKWRGMKYIFPYLREKVYGGGTFGVNTVRDHGLTIFLHCVTCVMIYNLFEGGVGLWTALLYAVNPINNQTSVWLNGRRYQLVVIMFLMALKFGLWGLILYPFMMGLQVTGFFLPVLLTDGFSLQTVFMLFVMLGVVGLGFKTMKEVYEERMKIIHNEDQRSWGYKRFIVIIRSYGFYFFKMIFPGVTMMNYPQLIKWGVTHEGNKEAYSYDRNFIKGLTALIATGFLINTFGIWGVFLFLGILQWSAVIVAFQQLGDRYMSLVTVVMMWMLVSLLMQFSFGLYIIVGLFCYYATQLNVTMQMYKTIDKFFNYQIFWHGEMSRNRMIYADSYLKVQDVTRAWLLVSDGLRYEPDDFELLYRAAQCSMCAGRIGKAKQFIDHASKNYYIGQEDIQEKRLARLEDQIQAIMKQYGIKEDGTHVSRQVRRAQERKTTITEVVDKSL